MAQITVQDVLGRKVIDGTYRLEQGSVQLDLSHIPVKGTCFIKVWIDDQMFMGKIQVR